MIEGTVNENYEAAITPPSRFVVWYTGRPNQCALKRSMCLSMLEEHLKIYLRAHRASSFNFSIKGEDNG